MSAIADNRSFFSIFKQTFCSPLAYWATLTRWIMVHCLAVGCSNTYKNAKGVNGWPFTNYLRMTFANNAGWLISNVRGTYQNPGTVSFVPIILPPTTSNEIFRYFTFFSFTSHSHEILRCGISRFKGVKKEITSKGRSRSLHVELCSSGKESRSS